MKKRSEKEIIAKAHSLWRLDSAWGGGALSVEVSKDEVTIRVGQMYEPPPLNLGILLDLAEFFGTKNIDDDRFSHGGCETCDYGSEYGFTLRIRPERKEG